MPPQAGNKPIDEAGFILQEMPWETEFFQKKFVNLKADRNNLAAGCATIPELLSRPNSFDIMQTVVQVDGQGYQAETVLQQTGFKLVETRLIFETQLSKPPHPENRENIRSARPDDLDELLDLTHKAFTDNENFYARFKNREYFSPADTRRYYAAWITGNISSKDCIFMVCEEEKIAGYTFLIKGRAAFKVGLTAILERYQGLGVYNRLAEAAFALIPSDRFSLINTTQLTNLAMLKTHIKNKRNLSRIENIYYYAKAQPCNSH
jgi:hypothetical protein